MIVFLNYPNNSTAAVNAIVFTDANGLILLIMRDQALVTKLLDVYVTVDNEDANLADINGITLFNEYLVSIVVSGLHAVTADRSTSYSAGNPADGGRNADCRGKVAAAVRG